MVRNMGPALTSMENRLKFKDIRKIAVTLAFNCVNITILRTNGCQGSMPVYPAHCPLIQMQRLLAGKVAYLYAR